MDFPHVLFDYHQEVKSGNVKNLSKLKSKGPFINDVNFFQEGGRLGSKLCRDVIGLLKVGGQVVIQVVMRRGFAAGGAFYSAKMWGGNCPPSLTPL